MHRSIIVTVDASGWQPTYSVTYVNNLQCPVSVHIYGRPYEELVEHSGS